MAEDCILGGDFFSRVGMQSAMEAFLQEGLEVSFCRRITSVEESVPMGLKEFFNNNSHELEENQKMIFAKLLQEFHDVFSEQAVAEKCEVLQHKIELLDSRPIKQVLRRIPVHLRSEVERIMEDMKEQGIIEESSSLGFSSSFDKEERRFS
ncbi:hypothetical protein P5V15_001283 [Pogonomyrmex californicus]